MNKVIHGKGYNTKTAKMIAEYNNGLKRNDLGYYEEKLYIKKTGEYFLHGLGGKLSKYGVSHSNNSILNETIIPMSIAEAKYWAKTHLSYGKYNAIFDISDNMNNNSNQQKRISLILPTPILEKLHTKKEVTGLTVSALIIKALREAGY